MALASDLFAERGATVLLRGPNGAGKTTLLRVIATAISPTYGGGTVLGFDLTREREAIRRETELLGHRTRLYEDLSAAENLRYPERDLAGSISPSASRNRILDVLMSGNSGWS